MRFAELGAGDVNESGLVHSTSVCSGRLEEVKKRLATSQPPSLPQRPITFPA